MAGANGASGIVCEAPGGDEKKKPLLSGSVRAEGEHNSVDTVHRAGKRVGASHVAGDHLRCWGKPTGLAGGAHQGTHGMALTECFLDDEAPDATGRTNHQHGHAGIGHNVSLLFGVAVTSSTTRNALSVRGYPMNGSNWVKTSISRARSLPTLRFAATWPLTCASHPRPATR